MGDSRFRGIIVVSLFFEICPSIMRGFVVLGLFGVSACMLRELSVVANGISDMIHWLL